MEAGTVTNIEHSQVWNDVADRCKQEARQCEANGFDTAAIVAQLQFALLARHISQAYAALPVAAAKEQR